MIISGLFERQRGWNCPEMIKFPGPRAEGRSVSVVVTLCISLLDRCVAM
jgi:hypothetical protein